MDLESIWKEMEGEQLVTLFTHAEHWEVLDTNKITASNASSASLKMLIYEEKKNQSS